MSRTALGPIRDIFRASFGCVKLMNVSIIHSVSYNVIWLGRKSCTKCDILKTCTGHLIIARLFLNDDACEAVLGHSS